MALIIALICALAVVAAMPLVFVRPSWVFYLFLASCLFAGVVGPYINQSGNLGLPRACLPSDILAWLTIVAALRVPPAQRVETTSTRVCLILIAVGAALCTVQGLFLHFDTALTESRRLHFLVIAMFGLRYFTDVARVKALIRFSAVCLFVMFVFQVLIRFGVYDAPAAEGMLTGQMEGESGEMSLAPVAYLGLVALGIARVAGKVRSRLASVAMLATGLGGIVLAETRTLAGAVAVVLAASIIFAGGRIRTLVVCILLAGAGIWAADQVGFKIGRKFQHKYKESGEYVFDPRRAIDGARVNEYYVLPNVYRRELYFLLTGRGLGAMHTNMAFRKKIHMSEWHSTYLGWMDMFGVVGLALFVAVHIACLLDGMKLARSNDPVLKSCGVAAAMLVLGLLAAAVFIPTLLHNRGGPYLILFFVIAANRAVLEASTWQEAGESPDGTGDWIPVAVQQDESYGWRYA